MPKLVKHQAKIVFENGKGNFYGDDGKPFLVRCPVPECARENYAPAVASGQCAWCGFQAQSSPDRMQKALKTDN